MPLPVSPRGPWPWMVAATFATWWVASGAGQHPLPTFDRPRQYDRTGLLLPNWRFFAPEPAQHDFHVLYRVLTADDEQTPWREAGEIAPRTWLQMIWFPGRRREKALFDVCNELLRRMGPTGQDVSNTRVFRMLAEFVEVAVRHDHMEGPLPKGFQFVIARYTGFDEDHEPEYLLASPFVPIRPAVGAA